MLRLLRHLYLGRLPPMLSPHEPFAAPSFSSVAVSRQQFRLPAAVAGPPGELVTCSK